MLSIDIEWGITSAIFILAFFQPSASGSEPYLAGGLEPG